MDQNLVNAWIKNTLATNDKNIVVVDLQTKLENIEKGGLTIGTAKVKINTAATPAVPSKPTEDWLWDGDDAPKITKNNPAPVCEGEHLGTVGQGIWGQMIIEAVDKTIPKDDPKIAPLQDDQILTNAGLPLPVTQTKTMAATSLFTRNTGMESPNELGANTFASDQILQDQQDLF
jgi:hypothetical protein